MIKLFKLITFRLAAVPANGTNIQHAIPEFDESSSFYWDVQVCNVVQQEIYQFLQFVFSQPGLEALNCNDLSFFVSYKAIFSEEEVELLLGCKACQSVTNDLCMLSRRAY